MEKKNGKRIGPVPITLVAVFALAAFISAGLLLAVNSGQQTVAEAQSSADCTIGPPADGTRRMWALTTGIVLSPGQRQTSSWRATFLLRKPPQCPQTSSFTAPM